MMWSLGGNEGHLPHKAAELAFSGLVVAMCTVLHGVAIACISFYLSGFRRLYQLNYSDTVPRCVF